MKRRFLFFALASAMLFAQSTADPASDAYVAKDWAKSAELYAAKLKANPQDLQAQYRLGASLIQLKRYQEAMAPLESHAKSAAAPFPAYSHQQLALAHAALGHKDAALDSLKKAADAGYPLWQQLESEPLLASMRSDARFGAAIDTIKRAAAPCRYDDQYRAFDFWIGDWEVFNQQGQKQGENRIEQVLGDCVLLENWTGGSGQEGKSFNSFNPQTKKWEQYWIAADGNILKLEGDARDGTVAFTGAYYLKGQSAPQPYKLTFTRLADGRVRQVGEGSNDGGKSYQVQYDLVYVKKKQAQ